MDNYSLSAKRAWEDILEKVQNLDKSGMRRAEISRLLGHKSRSAVSGWLDGSCTAENATFTDMLRYISVLGLNIEDYIQCIHVPTIKRVGAHAPTENVTGDGLKTIPVYLEAGAGEASEFFTYEPETFIQVLPQYFSKDLRAVRVTGDSMEPTIKKGAVVGVVPICGELQEGGIYLVRRPPFGLVVKRVMQDTDGQIVLLSDNPKWKPQTVQPDDYENIIIGKVVWIWQNV